MRSHARFLRGLHGFQRNFSAALPERAVMETDVLIVGGGPAGLAAAIRLGQLNQQHNKALNIMLIEKGGEIGSHILSGVVLEPRAFDVLFPEWQRSHGPDSEDPAPLLTPAITDKMLLLTEKRAYPLPKLRQLNNHGNWIVSLSEVTRWMGRRAEELGISLFPGFAGRQVLYDDAQKRVLGVTTNDLGLNKACQPKATFERGMSIKAKVTLFAEGCHGSLTKTLIPKFQLRSEDEHQTYGLGLKEVWEIPKEKHQAGLVMHTVGWPLDAQTYGGSFMYHYGENLVSLGLVIGLDYQNPYLNLYAEFQRLKTHPAFRRILEGGKCLAYGARALNEGGVQSIPKLVFPGGALIGCTAGFLNVPKIKGSHTAMESGMMAAESAFESLTADPTGVSSLPIILDKYEKALRASWVFQELREVRNVRPAFQKYGLYGGLLFTGIDQMIFRGKLPFTLKHGASDHARLEPASMHHPLVYPKADGVLTFDLMENVARTGTNHEEDQPVHLQLQQPDLQVTRNLPIYAGPEGRFCPAGVYEYVPDETAAGGNHPSKGETSKRFQINAQNCIHCKTCDIKDPSQNINWVPPEGGGGPQYTLT